MKKTTPKPAKTNSKTKTKSKITVPKPKVSASAKAPADQKAAVNKKPKLIGEWSDRLKKLPPYLFAEIDDIKSDLKERNVKFIDVSIGDPDINAPKDVLNILHQMSQIKVNQQYDLSKSKFTLRVAIKTWMRNRFGVNLDPESEIQPSISNGR